MGEIVQMKIQKCNGACQGGPTNTDARIFIFTGD